MWNVIEAASWMGAFIIGLAGLFLGAKALDFDWDEAGWFTGGVAVLVVLAVGAWTIFFGLPGGDNSPTAEDGESTPPANETASSDVRSSPSGSQQPTDPAPPSDPSISMEPDAGEAGDEVTIEGQGFRPGEQVRVTWSPYLGTDSSVLRDVTAETDGSFSAEVTIPQFGILSSYEDGGSVRVLVEGLTSERQADTYFQLAPK